MLLVFDGNGLHPSAMSDQKTIRPRIESGYAFTKDMIDELLNAFKNQNLLKSIAVLGIKIYKQVEIRPQHTPDEGKDGKVEVNRMRKGNKTDILTNVDIQETVIFGGKVNEIYEKTIYEKNFEKSFSKILLGSCSK